jgi:hypothetical protein
MQRKTWLIVVAVALFTMNVPSLDARQSRDPFDAVHSNLLRAATEELQLIRGEQRTTPPSELQSAESISSPPAAPGHITNPAMRRLYLLRPVLANIFREEGVPLEFLLVGLVESGYQAEAVSPAQAVGMWQFVPATARRFGLISDQGDFRTDLLRSTRTAATYLRFLHDQFQDWRLALAAYNAGEERVAEAIRKAGSRDFSNIANRHLLPEETLRYVPAVLRAIAEARNHGLLDAMDGPWR